MNPIKNNIIKTLNLDNLPESEKEDIIIRIGSLIYQNVLMRILETMPDEKQDEFEKLLDENSGPEKVFEFLNTNVENFEKIVTEEAEKFRDRLTMTEKE